MKKSIAAIGCMFALNSSNVMAQSPLVWAKAMGGTNIDIGYSTTTDASGNVYTVGSFKDVADFDPGTGVSNLTSAGDYDIFVQKLDASGNFVWAKRMGGTGADEAYGVAIDASGNVYTTGNFSGTVDFDPGAGTSNLTTTGAASIFVSKLDASGNFAWAKGILASFVAQAKGITINATGLHIVGTFSGVTDFDPGAGTANMTSSNYDIFVCKLDLSGNYVWAKSMGGTNSDSGNSIALDASGNVYTTGNFTGTVDFDPNAGVSNLTTAGDFDIFVSKLDASGNFAWAKTMGGANGDFGFGIAVDASANVYTTGRFSTTADFDPNTGVSNLVSAGGFDIFVSKLDASGNFAWAKAIGSTSTDIGYSITIDASSNIYTTGNFNGTADFNPNAGTFNLTAAGTDIFVSKLDASGNFAWAVAMGSTILAQGNSISVDASGNVYTTGYFQGTTDFDPNASTFNLTPIGVYDVFVSKLSGILLSTHKTEVANSNNKFNVYPNPAQNELNVSVSNASFEKTSLQIINIEGKIMQSTEETFAGNKIFTLNTQNLPAGMYVVRSQTANNTQSQRLVITK